MIPHYVYFQLAVVGLLWVCVMLHYILPRRGAVSPQPQADPHSPEFSGSPHSPESRHLRKR
jgi:hypothetical protein